MRGLIWFRRDLRTLDNTALIDAIRAVSDSQDDNQGLLALFVVTPEQWQEHHLSPMQADLIRLRLLTLSTELKALNISLAVETVDNFSNCPSLITEVCQRFDIEQVFANAEYELNETTRDAQVEEALTEHDVAFTLCSDKCVFTPGSLLNKQGSYCKVFTPFKKTWLQRFSVEQSVVHKPKSLDVNSLYDQGLEYKGDLTYPTVDSAQWHNNTKDVIAELRRFAIERASDYQQDRDFPALDGTSLLSPYLAIGMLSVRQCIARLLNGRHPEQLNEGEQTWLSELIWREFYQHLIYFEPKLCKGRSFVLWSDNLHWQGENEHLEKWQRGETGYPIIDAAMKQLYQTGWMHNRLRMVVASFLTKDLLLDWHDGEAYFMSQLVDGDFAANNGGWQWSASTGCDAQPYFRIFNPISQGQKFDPDGSFVKQWLPELKAVPTKYVHSPWLWADFPSLDYPDPIVDHKQQREKALQMYKDAKASGS
ncbi:deoxyribodipyrimidine photo-lyase [Vibrio inusitatus NBRC 102082]|uniref:Deoxyribodipyrimidine photo-lyase n=1 Tax=Vibrio inusitatus NBRC 102082 TaxID=1219070 RepID=A0A4Y3HUG7_9VIBR|nr:deoxyribodipyrimidine photo-lyase [Vibrio inusitatus]GEA50698.1 deoxyribodipyrimidine photo-lyase [Vibrio inusitatus NBRC 102082]